MTVRFTGGEPLLRDDFPELYLFARRLGLKVLLFTNATLITPQIADLLADIPPLEKIEISVYGMRRESYEAVTGVEGSYAGFLSGVQCLLDRKIPFVVKGALLPPNKKEMAEFAAWAATNPKMDAPPACTMFFDLRGRRDSVAKNRMIKRLRVSPEEGLEILTRDPDSYRKEMSEFFEKFLSPPGDLLFTCGIGPGCVDAYGVFHPCLSLRHPDFTFDLKKNALKEAVATGFPRLKEMRAANQLYLERCARCFLRGFCEQCPAKSWSEHGTLDTPVEYFCRVAHAQARFLRLVMEEERAWEVLNSEERIQNLKRRVTAS
jgi:radical SAM protein with 4Fe4S-binding SPASM domain